MRWMELKEKEGKVNGYKIELVNGEDNTEDWGGFFGEEIKGEDGGDPHDSCCWMRGMQRLRHTCFQKLSRWLSYSCESVNCKCMYFFYK